MARKLVTAEDFQKEVQRRVEAHPQVAEDQAYEDTRAVGGKAEPVILVAPPTPLRGTDSTGCNWTLDHYRGVATLQRSAIVSAAITEVMAQLNLRQ